ncbi:hypothetical protein ACFSTE_02400 [Aquimarina hainanensis]|uniref:Membrane domain of glycerophosphoryl diester phosphodiesterase n=1 Tax=Aquimarina hainanensis TaxID=1578017 RepID=A0ABW5N3K0_9FLAO
MDINQLLTRIDGKRTIDFGDIFTKSIELFKKVWIQGFVHLLLQGVIGFALLLLLYIPMILMAGIGASLDSGYGASDFEALEGVGVGIMILFVIFAMCIVVVLTGVQMGISAHFFKVCKQVDHQEPETSDYFMFLKKRYIGKTIRLGLSMFGIVLLSVMLCYLPLFYVLVPLHLTRVVYAFNPELTVSDLIKASFKLGNKYWLIIFGLVLISSMLSQFVGMLMCFVGVFFTASFVYVPIYYVYKEGVGFDKPDDLEEDSLLFIE